MFRNKKIKKKYPYDIIPLSDPILQTVSNQFNLFRDGSLKGAKPNQTTFYCHVVLLRYSTNCLTSLNVVRFNLLHFSVWPERDIRKG